MQVRNSNGDSERTELTHLILCEFVSGRVPTYWLCDKSQMYGLVADCSAVNILEKNTVTVYFGISFTGSYELGGDLTIGSISWRQQINR
jgi:hypothetical protein